MAVICVQHGRMDDHGHTIIFGHLVDMKCSGNGTGNGGFFVGIVQRFFRRRTIHRHSKTE